jgi:hypothetical protein
MQDDEQHDEDELQSLAERVAVPPRHLYLATTLITVRCEWRNHEGQR